jgi:maleylpyruvate isomerase
MATSPVAPVEALAAVHDAELRLIAVVGPLGDDDVAAPSRLPGWSVGHLVTHLARNADSHVRRTRASIDGVSVDQYPGGAAQREGEIEAGAHRPAAALQLDLEESSTRLLDAWSDVPAHAWASVTRDASGRPRPLSELPGRRWLEVEVHLVDLGCGPTHQDWPDAFVEARLPEMRAGATERLPDGTRLPDPGALDGRDELAWLLGRLTADGLPVLGSWS